MAKRMLIAEDDPVSARLLQQTMQKSGFLVEVVTDGKTALSRLEGGGYDVLLTDWLMPELDGIELVKKVRAFATRPYVAIVSCVGGPEAKAHALRSGADDIYAKPFVAAKLVAGIEAGIERRLRNGVQAAASPVDKEHPVAKTESWKGLLETARRVISDTAQLSLTHGEAPEDGMLTGIRCKLPLIDAEHLLEFHIEICADPTAAIEVARAMFGEPPPTDPAELKDMLGELANTVAGALCGSLGKEGFPFTMGLAKASDDMDSSDYALSIATRLCAENVEVVMRFGVRPRNCVRLGGNKLAEGMVLAENIYTGAGALILPSGVRLTASMTNRLQTILGNARTVKVCVPDT